MSSAVQTILRARGRVALIKITKPPVNSLGFAVRKGIADGLDAAEKDGASAVVFAGDGATFPAGADITEFAAGGGFKEPTLTDIIERVSALKLHTVAAIHGTALGGGLELALATCGGATDYDTYVRVLDAATGAELAANDDACGLNGLASRVSLPAGLAAGEYVALVEGDVEPAAPYV